MKNTMKSTCSVTSYIRGLMIKTSTRRAQAEDANSELGLPDLGRDLGGKFRSMTNSKRYHVVDSWIANPVIWIKT